MHRDLWTSHIICTKNLPAEYGTKASCEFHEADKQSSRSLPLKQHVFSNHVSENELLPRPNPPLSQQTTMMTWSSSSMSTLSTDSLLSWSDNFASRKCKRTGTIFGNLDPVPFDPEIDPEPRACFKCWQFDHNYKTCPDIKTHFVCCRNCGRRGVVMEDCPRCARAYTEFLNRLSNQCVEDPADEFRSVGNRQANLMEEESDVCWDDFIENDGASFQANFSCSSLKEEAGYQYDEWNDYQCPRESFVRESKLSSLNEMKAEVAKYKEEDWDDVDVNSYSTSQTTPEKFGVANFTAPKSDGVNYKTEDWGDCNQSICKHRWENLPKKYEFTNLINPTKEKLKYASDYWSDHVEGVSKSYLKESKTASLIVVEKESLENENDSWSECANYPSKNLETSLSDVYSASCFTSVEKINLQNENNHCSDSEKEVLKIPQKSLIIECKVLNLPTLKKEREQYQENQHFSDIEEYKSLQASSYNESETGSIPMELSSVIDKDYWTDFDDDYQSLQDSFAEDYKSFNTTIDDENDCTSTGEIQLSGEEHGFKSGLHTIQNTESNKLLSFIRNEKIENFAVEQNYKNSISKLNSLESSRNSQSDEAYLSHDEETEDFDCMIIDENERSEPLPSTGNAVQEFLCLLESLKHLPIQTQNVAVLHFVSERREQFWHDQMQNKKQCQY